MEQTFPVHVHNLGEYRLWLELLWVLCRVQGTVLNRQFDLLLEIDDFLVVGFDNLRAFDEPVVDVVTDELFLVKDDWL
jgi:hypothetical protein